LATFFVLGIGYMLAGAAVTAIDAAVGLAPGHWLALHLVFVGGVSQLVLGAGQFFAGAFLATDPPRRWLVRLQLGAWNAGTLIVAVSVPADVAPATIAGAMLLATGLGAFVSGLDGLRRRSLQRAPWAVRWYEACAGFLGIGVLIGVLLATGVRWSAGTLLGAHMALNLAGWFGTAIVGTLHTFFPSLTQTRLRFAALQPPTFVCWTLGTAALATGYALGAGPLVLVGWSGLTLAAALLCTNLIASLRGSPAALTLSARLIAAAQSCLVLALSLAFAHAASGETIAPPLGAGREAIAILLLPGWLGLTVLGSLLHLLAVLVRVRDFRRPLPTARPARDRVLVAAALGAVIAVAAARTRDLAPLTTPAGCALLASYLVLGSLVLARAAQAVRGGLPRI
jgi:nitrite reductase (NO-forming)